MLRKLKLYGELAEFIGHKEFEIKVHNVSQAVSFLIHNFPEVESYMNPKYYQVKVGNYDIDESELAYPIGQEDIHFIPVISGAGRGFGKILLGAALIAGAFLIPGLPGGAATFSMKAGLAIAKPIRTAPNKSFPKPLPAPLIMGMKCISSLPIG